MPRLVAYDVLTQVILKKRPLDEAFNSHPKLDKLAPKSRAFARAIATQTLRNMGYIDSLIDPCLAKRPKGNARGVMQILRMSLAQLYFMNVPAHACLSEAQLLATTVGLAQYKKLINAVLRRLEREKQDDPKDIIADKNIPAWLMASWQAAYGDNSAHAIALAHLEEPALDLTLRFEDEAEIWAKRLDARILPSGSLRISKAVGPIQELDGFEKGAWWVQDAAAAVPVKLFDDLKGKTVLDLCSAPGGKTLQLAAKGANVISIDKSKNRLKRVEENLERTGLKAEIIEADLFQWEPDTPVDHILLDAPCSATGTLRRHPDGFWTKKPEDVKALADLQGTLWHRASNWVKPGGTIVYCTCSLEPEEGEHMSAAFLKGHSNFEAVDGKTLRIIPDLDDPEGCRDGFYAIEVKRIR